MVTSPSPSTPLLLLHRGRKALDDRLKGACDASTECDQGGKMVGSVVVVVGIGRAGGSEDGDLELCRCRLLATGLAPGTESARGGLCKLAVARKLHGSGGIAGPVKEAEDLCQRSDNVPRKLLYKGASAAGTEHASSRTYAMPFEDRYWWFCTVQVQHRRPLPI